VSKTIVILSEPQAIEGSGSPKQRLSKWIRDPSSAAADYMGFLPVMKDVDTHAEESAAHISRLSLLPLPFFVL
jgi:hypothetical protein